MVGHHGVVVDYLATQVAGCASAPSTLTAWNSATGRTTARLGHDAPGGGTVTVALAAVNER